MADPPITVHADFPGGNIIVDRIEGGHARIRQDQTGSTERWFYWYFAVRHVAGRRLTVTFTDWDVIGTEGPAFSPDGGRTWSWLGRGVVGGQRFTHDVPVDASDPRYAFCVPYLQADLDAWHPGVRGLRRETLTTTPAGRDAELLRLGGTGATRRVLLTCRHHACEAAASFVLEGVIDAWADQPMPGVELVAVPFVDKDGVEQGDQGKQRSGHDHNRDYTAAPRYRETAAIMSLVGGWGAPPAVTLDLHCPWIRGPRNESIYIVGSPDPAVWANQQRFGEVLAERVGGELPYDPADNLPFGVDWNVNRSTPDACSCGRWMAAAGVPLAATVEVPYATVKGVQTTPANLRRFGEGLAAAIRAWLAQTRG